MSFSPVSVLYTQDPDLVRKTRAFLRASSQVRHVADATRLEPVIQQTGPAVLIMDLRAKDSRELLEQIRTEQPDVLIIALGIAKSEPLRDAEQLGIYAVEGLDLERRRFQALLARAFDYQRIVQENRDFRETSTMSTDRFLEAESSRASGDTNRTLPMPRFPRVSRRLDKLDALVESIVEAVADAAGVSRVGLFARNRKRQPYRLLAGLRCF